MSRKNVYIDDIVSWDIEYCEDLDMCFVHNQVFKWGVGEYKHILKTFCALCEALKAKGFDYLYAQRMNDKLAKYAKMMGFVETDMAVYTENKMMTKVMLCLLR